MLSRRFIEENPDAVRASLTARHHDFDLDPLLARLSERKTLLAELEELQAKRNAGSKEVGALFKAGKRSSECVRRQIFASTVAPAADGGLPPV